MAKKTSVMKMPTPSKKKHKKAPIEKITEPKPMPTHATDTTPPTQLAVRFCSAPIHDEESGFRDGQVLGFGAGLRLRGGVMIGHGCVLRVIGDKGMTLGIIVTCHSAFRFV